MWGKIHVFHTLCSWVGNLEGHFVASLNVHANAGIEGGEHFAGMDEQSLALAMAYEDAAVVTFVDAVAGFDHRAETGHHRVDVD